MNREVIVVPKHRSPIDVLKEIGERTKNAWIFFNDSAVSKLKTTADYVQEYDYQEIAWNDMERGRYLATTLWVERIFNGWARVHRIKATDIAFKWNPSNPEKIFFLQMEE